MKANENPFRSSNVERIRYALSPLALNALADTALDLRWCCLLGPKGTGKTTLLEDLEQLLEQRGKKTHRIYLNRESTKPGRVAALEGLTTLDESSVCLFDGAEVLNCWQHFRLRCQAQRQGFGLITTQHRKSQLPILHRTKPDWELAEELVRELSEDLCSKDLIQQAHLAFEQSSGNVREVFRACYWELAQART